jgi:hypothetical protein
VKYELGFYIPEDGILHSDRRENLKSYETLLVSEHFLPHNNLLKMARELHTLKESTDNELCPFVGHK